MGAAWKQEPLNDGALLVFISEKDRFVARSRSRSPGGDEILKIFKEQRPSADPSGYEVRGVQTGLRLAEPEEFREVRMRSCPKGTLLRWSEEEGRLQVPAGIGRKVRVCVVDDSGTIRNLLEKIFAADQNLEIVGSFGDPLEAEKKIRELEPDVVTLDIHMPGMDGVQLLKKILAHRAIPCVMISSLNLEEGSLVLEALESGAVDYIHKPSMKELPVLAPLIVEKIHAAAAAQVKKGSSAPRPSSRPSAAAAGLANGWTDTGHLVCLGSSTGGTEALKQVFLTLPAHIPPVLVVQHIPPVFSKAFADRMNSLCPFEVKEAADGDEVKADRILIAPGGMQMEFESKNGRNFVRIVDAPPMNRHKPSVDHLFFSVARAYKGRLSAAILTGMGADGANGLLELRGKGARTIAQDEETCVVYGMPREAAKRGAAEEVLPLGDIGLRLLEMLKAPR